MCFHFVLGYFWGWLLEDIPNNFFAAVIIGTALALVIYVWLSEVFGRKKMKIFEWRQILYQRVRDDVDRLHQDIITLRRQFDLDDLHNICFYKPTFADHYKEKLELLKLELNSFEKACYKNCEESTSEADLKIKERLERQGMLEDIVPNIVEWQKKCAREFQQWLQSTDFYDSELCNSKIKHYQHIKVQTRDQAEREARRKHETRECGGTWIWPIDGIPDLKIECRYMQSLQTSEMSEDMINETEEFETLDMTDSTISETKELQTSDRSRRRISEIEEFETPDMTDSTISETKELQTSDMSRRRISETEEFERQDMPGGIISETQDMPGGIVSETQDMPGGIVSETQDMPGGIVSETQDMPGGIISETQDMPGGIISETQDMPGGIVSETWDLHGGIISATQDMPASIVSETWDMPASIISETWDMPGGIISATQDMPASIVSETRDMPASIISETQDMPASIISETQDMPASIISETWDMPASIIQTQLGTIINEIQKLQTPGYMCNIMFRERQKLRMMDSRRGSVIGKVQAFE